MFSRIRIRNLLSRHEATQASSPEPESASMPGFYSPQPLAQLTGSTLRKNGLQQIWENCALTAEVYRRLYLVVLHGLLLRVQNVPAAHSGRWSQTDGFGDLTLQFTTCAVRLARGYMFPPGAPPEEQAAQGVMWNAVVFWSALFYHLPLLAALEGEQANGVAWQPGLSAPAQPYRFRFRAVPPTESEAPALAALAAGQLLPAEAVSWVSGNDAALKNLAGAVWNGHPEMALICSLLKNAAEQVESPMLLAGGYNGSTSLSTTTGTISFENSTSVAGSVTKFSLDTAGISAAPESSEDAFALLRPNDVPVDNITPVMAVPSPNADAEENHETDILISLFSGHGPADADGPESDAFLLTESKVEKSTKYPLEYQNEEIVNNDSAGPGPVTAGGISGGKRFFDWLCSGVNSGVISVNGKDDRLYVVAGYVFLPVPGIFYHFLKSEGIPGEQREVLQEEFERLNLHKRHDSRRFYFARQFEQPGGAGRFKPVKGYLVRGKLIFRDNIPQDSQYISFS